jgi:hypothetical protein
MDVIAILHTALDIERANQENILPFAISGLCLMLILNSAWTRGTNQSPTLTSSVIFVKLQGVGRGYQSVHKRFEIVGIRERRSVGGLMVQT